MTQAAVQPIPVNGVELAWWERGSASAGTPTLVLVHGFTGSSHDFALVADDLAVDRRVVLIDQRGHGHSTKTGTLEGYTIDQLVADLAVFLDSVGNGPIDLLGHSMGGRVAMGLVLSRPELVGSLMLMDTSAWSFLPPDDSIRQLVKAWIEAFDPAQGMPESMSVGSPEDALIEERLPASWQKEKQAIFAGMDAYAVKAFGLALMADSDEGETSLRSDLPSITCPTTVISGEHDHPLVDQAPELASLVANGRLAVIEGAYHSPQLTHAEEWKDAVRAHLAWADDSRDRR
jgi:2-succinyl-6-hydroxy-2,4-cyclohexadiene-1-carboxylate synthase